ncbi:hypothetical protein P171DRAFT_523127 [Karstenula rhodostoma CBS 690.94]|uniref:DUF7896 domain-containing protein n=1 Tax=Karstenula rhodostoma CBS 690.94 TaxID=1392251 RepID=A0A9P4U9L7_9PLEO|nr:hypothetical protein P171DRAFT_523127 [Karstenula rhodostoma CBS 690.94]
MATAFASSIDQLKQAFCNEYSHLSEQHRQQLWLQHVATLPTSPQQQSQAQHVPRSMSTSATNMTQLLVNSYGHMGRLQSPSAPPMEHSMSLSTDNSLQRSSSNMPNWQSSFDDQSSAYVFSDASMSRQQTLQPINTVEYSPDDYVNFIETSDNAQLPLSQPHHQPQLQLTPNNQWMPSLDRSASPSTPSTALLTPVTLSSNSMSRQSSFNPQFADDFSMLRSDSQMYPILPEDGSISFPPDVNLVQKSISGHADNLHFLSSTGFTGLPSETSFLSPVAPVSSASVHALVPQEGEPCLVEDMRRSASTSSTSASDSDASYASASPDRFHTRHVRREREIIAQAGSCKIAPKAVPSAPQTKSASPNAQMMRIQSEDGSSRHVGVISKAPYVRPQHPKILCPHCDERREGFRGTHELDRHVARAHTAVRKGFICVAPAFDKNFLSGCKHCRSKKVYGAYYNAAAHLRRAHFHPRKRGRKGKNDEKRGGIGGGDDPPMDYLKQHWIREIEVENKTKSPKNSHASPASSSDSASEHDVDAPYDVELAYPADVSVPSIEPHPYVDFSAYNTVNMNEVDAAAAASMYNASLMYATQAQQPPSDEFDFDAYRT